MPLREAALLGHVWPECLRIGGAPLFLVDDTHPTLKPLWEGESILGWEGDERLRVYICVERGAWELVRYENGRYSSISRIAETGTLTMQAMVGMWIIWLLSHDGRRGHDVLAAQDKAEAQAEAARDRAQTEDLLEVQDQLRHALHKDGVDEVWGYRSSVGARKENDESGTAKDTDLRDNRPAGD